MKDKAWLGIAVPIICFLCLLGLKKYGEMTKPEKEVKETVIKCRKWEF